MARFLRAHRYRLALAATGISVFTYIESLPTYNYRLLILPPMLACLLARLCASMPNSRGSRDARWICIKCSFVEHWLAKRTEQSDKSLNVAFALGNRCARPHVDSPKGTRDTGEMRGKQEKIDPNKNAHSTENASNFRRIKFIRSLDVDYREKIPTVRY